MKYAIRLPANDNLQRNIAELLTRPVGRPSHKPMVRYKSFLYQAASWNKARRVVAKLEFQSERTQSCGGAVSTASALKNTLELAFAKRLALMRNLSRDFKMEILVKSC